MIRDLDLKNLVIPIGDTTIELTEIELRTRAVSYLYLERKGLPMQRRYATPEEVLQSKIPDTMFQVSEDGYACMRAKAERLLALYRGERFT